MSLFLGRGLTCVVCLLILQDEIGKVQSGVRLDMNLEKSRNTEEVSDCL